MATGKLQIQVTSQLRAAPVEDAVIDISSTGEPDQILEEVRTDSVGQTDTLELEAPPEEYSLSPGEMQPYSEYNFRITAPGYEPLTISGAEILANQLPFLKQRTNITFKYETTMIGIICCTFTLRSRGAFLYPLHFLQINPSSTAFQLAESVLFFYDLVLT